MVAITFLPTFLTSHLMNSDRCLFNAKLGFEKFLRVYRFMTDLFMETIISILLLRILLNENFFLLICLFYFNLI